MAGLCGGLITGPNSSDKIENQLNLVMNYGAEAYNTAQAALQAIRDEFTSGVQSVGFSLGGQTQSNDPTLDLPDFQKSVAPDSLSLNFNQPVEPPNPPEPNDVSLLIGSAPRFTATEPSISLPPRPGALTATPPDDPAAVQVPEYPDDPTITLPPVPTLRDLNLPVLDEPDLSTLLAELETLRGQRPEAPGVFLEDNFLEVVDQQYALTNTRLKDFLADCTAIQEVCPRLTELLDGTSTGMPTDLAQALRDRANDAEDRAAFQAEGEVMDEWLARGFTLPAGVLDARREVVRQQARDRKSETNRAVFVQEGQWAIENLRFAIQQGIALEAMYRQSWLQVYDLSRNLAAQTFEIQLRILEARIAVFQAEVAAWQAEAAIFRDWLAIELAKIQIFRDQIDAQRLINEINQQDVEIYRARLAGVQTQVDVYRAQIEAANAKLQGELAKIEIHRSQVQAYTARVGAYEAEWRGFGEAVRGELGRTEIYKALTQAFGARVDAYRTEVDAKKAEGEFKVDVQRLRLETWTRQLEKFRTELQAEIARIEAGTRIFDSKVRLYEAENRAEDSKVGVDATEANLRLQRYQIAANIDLKEAELELQRTIETARTTISALDGIARTGSQLASGALSALNMSATITNTTSWDNNRGCSTNYSIDATP